jgi:hypothetical protein
VRADIELILQAIEDHIVIPLLTDELETVEFEAHGYKLTGEKVGREGFDVQCRKVKNSSD